jgi:hypothetical protein
MKTIARYARQLARWSCGNCGAINPDITGTCIRCSQ